MSEDRSAKKGWKRAAAALLIVFLGVAATPALASAQPTGYSAPRGVVCGGSYGSQLARLEACMRLFHFPTPKKSKRPPSGATALCRDRTYSFSHSRWVACRGHRGVSRWLRSSHR